MILNHNIPYDSTTKLRQDRRVYTKSLQDLLQIYTRDSYDQRTREKIS